MPATSAVCGLAIPVSTTENNAIRLPIAAGLKATLTVQEDPALSDAPQVFAVTLKSLGSAPVNPKLVKLSEPEPPAVRVKVWAAVVTPTVSDPKLIGDGAMVSVAVGAAVPVPVRATVCGLLLAASVSVSVAVRVPIAVGSKLRLMVQVAEGFRPPLLLQVVVGSWKSFGSVPVMVIAGELRKVVPLFFSVAKTIPLLVPSGKLPKLMLVGVTVAVPPPPLTPEPVSKTP